MSGRALATAEQATSNEYFARPPSTKSPSTSSNAEQDAARKAQIGSGGRSEKIRTYNFPQSRLTDHRIGYTSHNLPAILDGDLGELVGELATRDAAEKMASLTRRRHMTITVWRSARGSQPPTPTTF